MGPILPLMQRPPGDRRVVDRLVAIATGPGRYRLQIGAQIADNTAEFQPSAVK